jgi:hypothetical protein
MPHLQQQTLDAIRTALVAGATAAGARVFVDRVDPLQANELPAILVDESDGESVEVDGVMQTYRRSLAVRVICATGGSGAMAAARELGLQVERLLAPQLLLGGLASGGLVLTASRPTLQGEGDRLMALRELDYTATNYSQADTPDVAI